jgi:diaminohydroxyphosphoribosylaminopyrimidine deaminase/5-amino-6-(5-phosphoribosylamino)uracil reductase
MTRLLDSADREDAGREDADRGSADRVEAQAAHREATDRAHMARALELAARGLYTTDPNPRVGCVLARGCETLGEGWHERAGEAHAEVAALGAARADVRGATAYVSLEPCSHVGRTPPCVDALIAAGIGRVVCASIDPNPRVAGAGIERLKAAGIPVAVGILEPEARALNPGFFSRFERGRPYVRLKLAMSLDGRTAPAGGGAAWISSETSRADVQRWRARSSAVLTGSGTVRTDDPRLDVRLAYGPWIRQPLRVVLDTTLGCASAARVFAREGAVVFTSADTAPDAAARLAAHSPPVAVERVPVIGGRLDLDAVLTRLAALEVNELLLECGPRLAAGFLEAGLVDEWILYVAPRLLGADAAPLAAIAGLDARGARFAFDIMSVARLDTDVRLVLEPRVAAHDSRRTAPAGQGAERCSRE